MNDTFRRFAARASRRVGSSMAFVAATLLVVAWFIGGFAWGFTDSWLLLINTTSSVTTFLIVFLIQNSQNRSSRAMQLKLDELLKGVAHARTDMVNLEEMTDSQLDAMQDDYRRLREKLVHGQQRVEQERALRQQKP